MDTFVNMTHNLLQPMTNERLWRYYQSGTEKKSVEHNGKHDYKETISFIPKLIHE